MTESERKKLQADVEHAALLAKIDQGVREGVAEALLEHALLGRDVVIERDGKILTVSARELLEAQHAPK